MAEDVGKYAIIGMVAIVAVVGLVVLGTGVDAGGVTGAYAGYTYVVTSALYKIHTPANAPVQIGALTIEGTDAPIRGIVDIRNAVTKVIVGSAKAKNDGTFKAMFMVSDTIPGAKPGVPCTVQAGMTDGDIWGPVLEVTGADPETCEGLP